MPLPGVTRRRDHRLPAPISRGEFYRRFVLMLQQSRNTRFFTLTCYLSRLPPETFLFADGVSMVEIAKSGASLSSRQQKF
jgi:hypothetical protein